MGRAAPAASKRSGFTLIELMLAVVLLVGGVAACSFMMSRGIFAAAHAETVEQAVALAQERLERIRGATFASIVSESKAAVPGWTGFSRQVSVSQPGGTNSDFKRVDVTVYWNTNTGELSSSLTSHVVRTEN